MRLFLAIELSEEARQALAQVTNRLAYDLTGANVRFTATNDLHITLKFLGETSAEVMEEFMPPLSAALSQAARPTLTLSTLGCFPNQMHPRVVWAGAASQPADALVAIHTLIDKALSSFNIMPDTRPFTGHITLARLPGRLDAQVRSRLVTRLTQPTLPEPVVWTPQHVTLFESVRAGMGAPGTLQNHRYSALQRLALS